MSRILVVFIFDGIRSENPVYELPSKTLAVSVSTSKIGVVFLECVAIHHDDVEHKHDKLVPVAA